MALAELTRHRIARDQLRAWLAGAGEPADPPPPAYRLPGPVETDAQARALLATVELRLIPLYAQLVADEPAKGARRAWAIRAIRHSALAAHTWVAAGQKFPGRTGSSARCSPGFGRSLGIMGRYLLAVVGIVILAGCSSTAPAPTPSAPSATSPEVPAMASPAGAGPTLGGDVVTDLKAPWSVVPLSKGRALISERDTARILLLKNGRTTVVANPPEVRPEREGGLLGLAVRTPEADEVYAYYTAATDNRVVVFDFDGRTLNNERTILGGIPKGQYHNGGRIAFGPDGYLYVATGETDQPELAQDRGSLAGKILRITPSGTPAPGNPDPASPVWSYGHRNVQGLAWDAQGRMWATEFGQEDVDELNLIEPGNNYGWPQCEGDCDVPGTTNPKATWSPTATSSPSGLAIVNGSAWVAALRGQTLFEVPLRGDQAEKPRAWFAQELGRLRDVVETPDGDLWVMTNNTDSRGQPGSGDDRIVEVALP